VKVVSAQPPISGDKAPSAIVRPADAKISRTMRITANYPLGSSLPQEGSVLEWTEANQNVVQDVTRGADGQLNVTVQAGRP
jgi:hypothetical protein